MQTPRFLALCLAVVAAVALGGCSSACTTCEAPAPVAQAPCDPTPVCAVPTDPVVQDQRPPDARPGEVWCYVRLPAVTQQVTEQVCVRPASCQQVWVPPETQEVAEQVCVRPASRREIPIPPEYKTVEEPICVAPARVEWQRVDCEPTSLAQNEQLGECWMLKEIPAQYRTQTRQVCVREASVRYEEIPAEFSTVTKTVEVRPGYYRTVETPAQYETRVKEVVVCGPRWEWRRTTECEVPALTGAQGGVAPTYAPYEAPEAPSGGSEVPAGGADVPPTGLPPLDSGQ